MKKKFTVEYPIKASPKILYDRISTPWGLAEWFADDVMQQNDIFTFIWDKYEQRAELQIQKELKLMRFRWLDDEDENTESDLESYFEISINTDEITNDVAIEITDFAEEEEEEDAIELWNTQIDKLRHALGS